MLSITWNKGIISLVKRWRCVRSYLFVSISKQKQKHGRNPSFSWSLHRLAKQKQNNHECDAKWSEVKGSIRKKEASQIMYIVFIVKGPEEGLNVWQKSKQISKFMAEKFCSKSKVLYVYYIVDIEKDKNKRRIQFIFNKNKCR